VGNDHHSGLTFMTTDNSVNERQLEPTNAMVRHVDDTLLIEINPYESHKEF